MDLELTDRIALVTGSTAGIGRAIAEALAREGARVIVNGRSQKSVDDTVREMRASANAKVEGFAGDLADAAAADEVARRHPDVEILINNLGIFDVKPFEEIPDEDWFRFFEVNVMSGVRLSRHYLPGMKQRNWGRILFVSSESGVQIPSEMIHYGMTKTAQLAIGRGLAETTAGSGVTVNTLLPGPTASEGANAFMDNLAGQLKQTREQFEQEFFKSIRPSSLLKRFERPEEIGAMAAFLCSPLASATNGAAIRADGGVVRSIV